MNLAAVYGLDWRGKIPEDQAGGGHRSAGKEKLGFERGAWERSRGPAGWTPSTLRAPVELPLPCPRAGPVSLASQGSPHSSVTDTRSLTHGPLASLYASSVALDTHFVSHLLPRVPA